MATGLATGFGTGFGFWRRLWARHWNVGALVVIVLAVFAPILGGRILFMRDPAHFTFPLRAFMRASWLAGELPAWDSTQGLGFAIAADPLLGTFYPPNWIYLLPGTARLVTLDSLLHLIWGGIGAMRLLSRWGARPAAALVGGLAWSLSGVSVGMWTAGLILQAMAWLPWAALAGVRFGEAVPQARTLRAGVRVALPCAVPTAAGLLQGEVFLAAMGVLFAVGLAVPTWRASRTPDAGRASRTSGASGGSPRAFALGLLAIAFAGGLAAANLVPVALAAPDGARAAPLSLDEAERWSLPPARAFELLAPGIFGHPLRGYPGGRLFGEPEMKFEPLAYSVYLGGAVLFLALVALRRRAATPLVLATVALFALATAMGSHLPVHRVVRWLLPFAYMRYPEKFVVLVGTAAALLAGLGAERVLGEAGRGFRRGLGLLVLPLLGIALHAVAPQSIEASILSGAVHAALAIGVALAVVWVGRARPSLLAAGLPLIVAADLGVSAWRLLDFATPEVANGEPAVVGAITAGRRDPIAAPRLYREPEVSAAVAARVPAHDPDEYELRYLRTLPPNLPSVFGLASVPGYDAAMPAAWMELWQRGVSRRSAEILRLADVEALIAPTDGDDSTPGDALVPTGLDPLPGSRLFRVRDPLPRVFTVGRVQPVAVDEVPDRVLQPDVSHGQIAITADGDPEAAEPLSGVPGPAGACRIVQHANRTVVAECRVERVAEAIFVEQFSPGWSATVDGAATPIHRVNLVMRGVRIGPGTHRIEMRYAAPGQVVGLAVSLACLALLLAFGRWTPRPAADTPTLRTARLRTG